MGLLVAVVVAKEGKGGGEKGRRGKGRREGRGGGGEGEEGDVTQGGRRGLDRGEQKLAEGR